jgi:hypothetical protein
LPTFAGTRSLFRMRSGSSKIQPSSAWTIDSITARSESTQLDFSTASRLLLSTQIARMSDKSYPHGGRCPVSGDTIGKTSRHKPATDWRRLHEMTDEEVQAEIADDPDLRPLDENFWKTARLVGQPSRSLRSAVRFNRAVTRISIEASWLQRYQIAIDRLETQHAVGTDFFRVAFIALQDARLVRLIRLLEESRRTASFWYLHRVKQSLVESAVERVGLNLNKLKEISAKLRSIRNGAFIHIDKQEVFDSQRLCRDAGVQAQDIRSVSMNLLEAMKEIYRVTFGKGYEYDEYDGSDVSALARLRDIAEAEGLEK